MIRYSVILAALGLLISTSAVMSEDVPDSLSDGKTCEKLYEDAQIRVMRCTMAPGAVHARHRHPGELAYMISGGKAIMQDDKGTREWQPKAGEFYNNPPIPWHETTNVGNTTMISLVIEKKYEPVATK